MKVEQIKKIWKLFQFIELLFLGGLFLITIVPRLFGINPYVVLTGSMEPNIPVGTIVYVDRKYEPSSLQEGDVVTFRVQELLVTHRVVENQVEEQQIITKGDANTSEDFAPVSYASILGKTIYTIPVIGHLFLFVKSIYGWITVIGLVILHIVIDTFIENA